MHKAVSQLLATTATFAILFAVGEREAQAQLLQPHVRPGSCNTDSGTASATYSNHSLILTSNQVDGEWSSYAFAVIAFYGQSGGMNAVPIQEGTLTFNLYNDSSTNGRYQVVGHYEDGTNALLASGDLTQPDSDTHLQINLNKKRRDHVVSVAVLFEHLPKAGPATIVLTHFHLNGKALAYDTGDRPLGCTDAIRPVHF